MLANRIAEGIALQLNLDQEKRSVIAYGLTGILQTAALLVIITAIGVLSDSLYESLIIFLSVGFMRKSTGGAHSKTMGGCNTVSVLSIGILACASRYLLDKPVEDYINIGITITVFLAGFIVFYMRVPVDSPNKPIVSTEKVIRLRRESYEKLLLLLLLTAGAIALADSYERFYSIASSIRAAIFWQTITLTETGIALLDRLDILINSVLGKLK